MKIDASLRDRVQADFDLLNIIAAANAFPGPNSLSDSLDIAVPPGPKKAIGTKNIGPEISQMFTTAAVDMWLRAVHSFLISGSLTAVSPLWASVTGYYSSHYSMRAFAHLLGFFRQFTHKRMLRSEFVAGRHICSFKHAGGREHELYWKTVKEDPHFSSDPFFPPSNVDVEHRDWANYVDHLSEFRPFRPLDKDALKGRIERISEIPFALPPVPDVRKYPDVDAVQIVAYHRIVRFRGLVDALLVGRNRFWEVYRNPSWAMEFMDFQLTAGRTLHSEFTL